MNKEIIENRKIHVIGFAVDYGWMIHDWQENISMISFIKNGERINIYLSTMTVTTQIKHPKKGKTQLFRKGIGWDELKKIMENPRVHTNKGYYTTKK